MKARHIQITRERGICRRGQLCIQGLLFLKYVFTLIAGKMEKGIGSLSGEHLGNPKSNRSSYLDLKLIIFVQKFEFSLMTYRLVLLSVVKLCKWSRYQNCKKFHIGSDYILLLTALKHCFQEWKNYRTLDKITRNNVRKIREVRWQKIWEFWFTAPTKGVPSNEVMSSPFLHKTIFFSESFTGDLMLYIAIKF